MATMREFFKKFFPTADVDDKGGTVQTVPSPITPSDTDGADEVREHREGENTSLLDNYVRRFTPEISSTRELINTYRQMEEIQEVDRAIQAIVDQAIVNGKSDAAVSLNMEDTELSENIQEKVKESFDKILRLYQFRVKGGEIFRRWYVDSRSHYFLVVDPKNKKKGVQDIRYMDPRRSKKVREYTTKRDGQQKIITGWRDYYEYAPVDVDKNKWAATSWGTSWFNEDGAIMIPSEHVAFAHSGRYDFAGNMIGHLHQAIKPANQLKLIEDHIVIYRISRAPERRVFYVDIGNLPRSRAFEYVDQVKKGVRRKVSYDTNTGKIKSDHDSHSVMEDIWLPRKNGKNTEVDSLAGGENLGEIRDLEYFKGELWESLKIPKSRYEEGGGMLGGRETEISRDELSFHKFVQRLRDMFAPILMEALGVDVVAQNILSQQEWETAKEKIVLEFFEDSYFQELMNSELLQQRLGILRDAEEYVGKYFSHEYVMREILQMTDEQMETMKKQIQAEEKDEFWKGRGDDEGGGLGF